MATCQVVCQNHDVGGNPIGRYNQNPTLDTHLYEVEFPRGEKTEFEANIIAALICAKCDVDGNEYLMAQVFVDHRKNDSTLGEENQKVVVRG